METLTSTNNDDYLNQSKQQSPMSIMAKETLLTPKTIETASYNDNTMTMPTTRTTMTTTDDNKVDNDDVTLMG